ncbi:NAD(+) synthase [Halalkalibacillus sediminis]|uniref:NH(3)-dependent NAD(+) synthetase n=1 Tax=Halalkalibacillus sediminis TaxID=2018042 RepID=A0A2I0QXR4_9BACI|nr:NAD(+) synthase [Halalkalibacillus sediminis]PKR79109.1 NAD(+) synthase [Halalkalibacillus sediminis]
MEKHIDQLTKWLQQQVEEANVNGLVVGLSGGIDSSVVGYLIKRAMPEHSLGVIMPCKSGDQDQTDAQAVVKGVELDHLVVDLSTQHDSLFGSIQQGIEHKKEWNDQRAQLADANLRARLRMSTLYTVATNYNYLVVGTDNAAEWYTGYFTKYGDGGVDLVPLLHYTKSEVRELAKELGVPNQVIEKAPSAGLWHGQTDEEEMGVSYDVIDAYLKGDKDLDEKDVETIEKMHNKTSHKRALPKSPPDFHYFTLE